MFNAGHGVIAVTIDGAAIQRSLWAVNRHMMAFGKTLNSSFNASLFKNIEKVAGTTGKELVASGTKSKRIWDGFLGSLRGISSNLRAIGRISGIALGTSGIGVGAAVNAFAKLEWQLSRVKAIGEPTAAEFGILKRQAMELGQTTNYTSAQMADAQQLLAAAGYNAADTLSLLPEILKIATIEGVTLHEATLIVTGTMAAFSMSTKDASYATDILANAAVSSKATLTQLGESMKYIGSVASQQGLSIEDLTAALMVLSQRNIYGSMAGTALGRTLFGLSQVSGEKANLMKSLGIDTIDKSTGKLKDLGTLIDHINEKLAKYGPAAKGTIIAKLAGEYGKKALAPLLLGGGDEFRKAQSDLQNSAGASQKMFGTMMDNMTGSLLRLKGAFTNTLITIGKASSTYIRPFVDAVANALRHVNDWVLRNKELVAWMLGLAVKIGVVISTALGFATAISIIIGMLNPFTILLTTGLGLLLAWGQSLFENQVQGQTFGEKMANIGTWVTQTWAWAVSAMAPIFLKLRQVWNYVVVGFQNWPWVMKYLFWATVWGIGRMWDYFRHFFVEAMPKIWYWFAENWQSIFWDLCNWTNTVLTNLFNNLASFAQYAWDKLTNPFSNATWNWTPLTQGFIRESKKLGPLFQNVMESAMTQTAGFHMADNAYKLQKAAEKRWFDVNFVKTGQGYNAPAQPGGPQGPQAVVRPPTQMRPAEQGEGTEMYAPARNLSMLSISEAMKDLQEKSMERRFQTDMLTLTRANANFTQQIAANTQPLKNPGPGKVGP